MKLKCQKYSENSKEMTFFSDVLCLSRPCLEAIHNIQCVFSFEPVIKDKDYCLIEIIKGLTDKGQFQYLTKLMGPQEGTYLYATQFHSLR